MSLEVKNRKARFEYEFLDDYVAGIVLTGSEIKSIRNNKVSIAEAYCVMNRGELFVRNMYIEEYSNATYNNHEPRRERKLLMNKSELKKLERKLKDKGLTIVASLIFINEKNKAKLKIHLARGKKLHDKRDSIKEKDQRRDLARIKKIRG